MTTTNAQPTVPEKKRAKGRVKSFFADTALDRHIRVAAAKLQRDESWVMRFIMRKHFGLKQTGDL